MNKKIFVVLEIIPNYKVELFNALYKHYRDKFIVYKTFGLKEGFPKDCGPNCNFVFNQVDGYFWGKNDNYRTIGFINIYQVLKHGLCDVMILSERLQTLSNIMLFFILKLFGKKIIIYGHGLNRQDKHRSMSRLVIEKIRATYYKYADAAIVYSKLSRDYLINRNINQNKIFISQNTLFLQDETIIPSTKLKIEEVKNIVMDKRVIVFLGRIVEVKKFDLFTNLISYLNRNHSEVFGLVIGDNYHNVNFNKNIISIGSIEINQIKYFYDIADCTFIPGMVGLPIVHSFYCGKPFFTLNYDIHSPEIEYLIDGYNGKVLNYENYLAEFEEIFYNKNLMQRLSANSRKYYIENLSFNHQVSGFIDAIDFLTNSCN